MEITITIPEELTNQLHTDTQELERRVREKVAAKLYQEGASEEQIRRLLNLDTRFEVHALLKRHGCPCGIRSRTWRTIGTPCTV